MAETPPSKGGTDREFTITRVFDAPRHLVWQAWTEPERFASWFAPRGFTTPLSKITMDLRPGGTCEFVMVSDEDGSEYPNGGIYLEVVAPERLVFRDRDVDLVVTITFRDLGDRTEMTCRVVGETGGDDALAGWSSSFDKLAESLARV
jgi:uncharacterized protein YndB with AHSA1/START domain